MTNLQEMLAGTDPTAAKSVLTFESSANPGDLIESDQTPIGAGQFALYFQSVPGKSYDISSCEKLNGPWNIVSNVSATTTQKRVVIDRPTRQAFYRVTLHP